MTDPTQIAPQGERDRCSIEIIMAISSQVLERSKTKNCSLGWVKVTGGEVPDGAVRGGYNGEKKDIFICKVDIDNEK